MSGALWWLLGGVIVALTVGAIAILVAPLLGMSPLALAIWMVPLAEVLYWASVYNERRGR